MLLDRLLELRGSAGEAHGVGIVTGGTGCPGRGRQALRLDDRRPVGVAAPLERITQRVEARDLRTGLRRLRAARGADSPCEPRDRLDVRRGVRRHAKLRRLGPALALERV